MNRKRAFKEALDILPILLAVLPILMESPRCGGTEYLPYVNYGLSYGDPDYGDDPDLLQGLPCGCDKPKSLQCTICGQEKER